MKRLRFRIDVDAPANINARISHLAEGETASLKNLTQPAPIVNVWPGNSSAVKSRKGRRSEGHQDRTHLRL
jgi:hypothetical protein